MSDYTTLFSTLASGGATFVALTGGLVLQRTLQMQATLAGHQDQFQQADSAVKAAQDELCSYRDGAQSRYVELAISDDRLLRQVYDSADRVRRGAQGVEESGWRVRFPSILTELISPTGSAPTLMHKSVAAALWEYALVCLEDIESWVAEMADPDDPRKPEHVIAQHEPPPIAEPQFNARLLWSTLAYFRGQDAYYGERGSDDPDDYVHGRIKPQLSVPGSSIWRLRDELTKTHYPEIRHAIAQSETSLNERISDRSRIIVPKFDRNVYVEAAVTLGLIFTLVALPVLYLTPGTGEAPTKVDAILASVLFLAGTILWLGFFLGRARLQYRDSEQVVLRTREETAPRSMP
ncbi:hypothetical protein [Terrabacter sp. NPDC000476]|uniref:hypothetical protein n=1 Tax=Terrabacter sp. NPDC000476 TaxID=3154258 RepID=UPI00331ECBC5